MHEKIKGSSIQNIPLNQTRVNRISVHCAWMSNRLHQHTYMEELKHLMPYSSWDTHNY